MIICLFVIESIEVNCEHLAAHVLVKCFFKKFLDNVQGIFTWNIKGAMKGLIIGNRFIIERRFTYLLVFLLTDILLYNARYLLSVEINVYIRVD